MKKALFIAVFSILAHLAHSQDAKPVKIAVFAPVYLDSVFEGEVYKAGKANIPRYIISGLDFYNGVMMAIDSLNRENVSVEVLFYDTKSAEGIEQHLSDTAMQDVSMIIASFKDLDKIQPMADFALSKKILLISATYPNNGGIRSNPSLVLVNPTLMAHLEGVYRYAKKNYPTQTITFFRKRGDTEDMIENVFQGLNKKTAGTQLKMRTVTVADSVSAADVAPYLDSNRQNIIICGSLNESFGASLTKALALNKNYRCIAIGMPTWDGVRDISKEVEVVYSTPYNFSRTDKTGIALTDKYKTRYAGRATDMVFKGFETMYHFTKLLLKYGAALPAHLSDKEFKLFNDFDFQPVKAYPESVSADYLENRKLYFIRKKDGVVRSVN